MLKMLFDFINAVSNDKIHNFKAIKSALNF